MEESYPGERYKGFAAYWDDMSFAEWVDGLESDELSVWLMVFCDVEIVSYRGESVAFRSPHPLPTPVASAVEDRAEEILYFLSHQLPEDLRDEFCN